MRRLLMLGMLLCSAAAVAEEVDSLGKARELNARQPDKHILVYYKNYAS